MVQFRVHSIADVTVVEFIVPGLSDICQFEELSDRLHELAGRSRSKKITLDFSRVQFLASRALGILIALHQMIEQQQGKLVLCGLNGRLKQVFQFAGLGQVLAIYDTREDALTSLTVPVEP